MASAEVVYVATPEPFRAPVPRVVAPFLKVTVPVGVGTPEFPVTFAVNVTADPTAIEDADAVNAVVVDPAVITTVTELDVDAIFRESPA